MVSDMYLGIADRKCGIRDDKTIDVNPSLVSISYLDALTSRDVAQTVNCYSIVVKH